ncbi:bifunctional nuclease family protein [Spirosoma rhododendri]|uniref:Bifunctional nuclease family protein n=1 Tax=Spirosoma rhododendri TaxID=2728024 RepID=A0A7L5DLQ3_9BACT|nr:bifunctional nuclease family protein [Spirosoma rhododendri]QJD79399.1 bifunctional nuclease family protein [Spirosoma rhododendri]
MDKIKLEILALSPSQTQTGSFALLLGEEYGNRRLPILIGMFEAQAIAIEIEKIVPNRPMTHDLFKQMAEQFKFTVREIVISDLREGIFYARIVCFDGVRETAIDARPSDAVAIGIRFGVPIYTNESVLSEAGITNTPSEEEGQEELVSSTNRPSNRSFSDQLKNASSEELQTMLDAALGNEEYERAAKIRDEMSKRN